MLDPLGVVTKTRLSMETEETGPADAPSTIVRGEEMQRMNTENYFYNPDMGQVPDIEVPADLPFLPGMRLPDKLDTLIQC